MAEAAPRTVTSDAAAPGDSPASSSPGYALSHVLMHTLRRHWLCAAVMAAYLLAAILLPTGAPVAISDDWTYARSVEYLVREGRFHILPVAAATQVFQLLWGSLFALVLGMEFGSLRLSTLSIVAISGVAVYGIGREIGVSRNRAALGAALYLFNPVLFPITYSFMSDPHFLALLTIASYWYVRGLRPGRDGDIALVTGSVVAALACLQRPHGALIPLAAVVYLVVARRIAPDRSGLFNLLRVAAIPALTTLAYYGVVSRGVPSQQSLFLDELRSANASEAWLLFRRLSVMELAYAGLFVLPISAATLTSLWALLDMRERRTWLLFLGWVSAIVAGLVWFWSDGRRMPYIPHFFGRAGPGSGDLRAARPPLAEPAAFDWLTIACAGSAIVLGLVIVRSLEDRPAGGSAGAGMLLTIAALQVLGVLPQSFLFRNWIVSLDRYLLPLLPFVIVLMLWGLAHWRIRWEVGWTFVIAVGLFSAIGTRDVLVFQSDVWGLAEQLNRRGVPNTRLDAGYAWDAYHLWEFGEQFQIERRTPDGTWWTDVYAKPTDSTYVIAGGPIPGYTVLSVHPYSAWLQRDPVALYVLKRENAEPDGVVWP